MNLFEGVKKLKNLSKLNFQSFKTIVLSVLSFAISYLSPIIGIIIVYCENKKKTTSKYKKAAIAGIVLALLLFTINYFIYSFTVK